MTLRFDKPLTAPPPLRGGFGWDGAGHEWTALFDSPLEHVESAALKVGARVVERGAATLDEIFFARTNTRVPAPAPVHEVAHE